MNAIARWCVIAVVCVSALVGCGGGSDDKAGDEPSSSETSSSPMAAPSSTAPPTYVENESCRCDVVHQQGSCRRAKWQATEPGQAPVGQGGTPGYRPR
jgi:hypothetical protein